MTEVSSLSKSQEEADTRMFLHAQYALNHLQGNIINSPNTDLFMILLMVSEKLMQTLISKPVIKIRKE